jgi:hypothetical protein
MCQNQAVPEQNQKFKSLRLAQVGKGTAEDAYPQVGVGLDTHEVMAISTTKKERGIQRPKQQNVDTTCM